MAVRDLQLFLSYVINKFIVGMDMKIRKCGVNIKVHEIEHMKASPTFH